MSYNSMKIIFENVTKIFFKQEQRTLKELIPSLLKGAKPGEFLEALKNISFEIRQGDVVGVLGQNGAGKSTMLKLIANVTAATVGRVITTGRIAPLIELGAGFHPELTGRENVYLNGSILGLGKREIDGLIDDIVKFAELSEFIDTPLKHYSSGMQMRLGFAIAVHAPFEILLTDEVLAVGDLAFQKKCLARMNRFKKQKKIIIFVSHDLDAVSQFCTKGLVLHHGELKYWGSIDKAVKTYKSLLKIK